MANFFGAIIKCSGLGVEAATTVDPDDYTSVTPEQYAEHYKTTGALGCQIAPAEPMPAKHMQHQAIPTTSIDSACLALDPAPIAHLPEPIPISDLPGSSITDNAGDI